MNWTQLRLEMGCTGLAFWILKCCFVPNIHLNLRLLRLVRVVTGLNGLHSNVSNFASFVFLAQQPRPIAPRNETHDNRTGGTLLHFSACYDQREILLYYFTFKKTANESTALMCCMHSEACLCSSRLSHFSRYSRTTSSASSSCFSLKFSCCTRHGSDCRNLHCSLNT